MESKNWLSALALKGLPETFHYVGEEPDKVKIVDSRSYGEVNYLPNLFCWKLL